MAEPKSDRLQLRIASDDKAMIEQAAALSGQTISEFVLANVRDVALNTIVDQRLIQLDDDAWAALEARLYEPPRVNEGLRDLLSRPRPE